MSRCYTMNTDLINKTQNITMQVLFNQVITLSLGSVRYSEIPFEEVKILAIWGTTCTCKHSWGQKGKNVKGSDSSAHLWNEAFSWINKSISILFFPLSRNLSNYFWRVTSIISFIFPPVSLGGVRSILLSVSAGKCEIEHSINQFFAPSILQLFYFSASILHPALLSLMKMLLTAAWC